MSTVRLNSAAQELSNVIKAQIPDAIDARRLLFYYLTKARVDRKTFKYNGKLKPITLDELRAVDKNLPEAAKTIEKIFNEYYNIFGAGGERLVFNKELTIYLYFGMNIILKHNHLDLYEILIQA